MDFTIKWSRGIVRIYFSHYYWYAIGGIQRRKFRSEVNNCIVFVIFLAYFLDRYDVGSFFLLRQSTARIWIGFPTPGMLPSDASFWGRVKDSAAHLTLPVVCLTYPSLAFIARQMRGSMADVMEQDYMRTAVAKGLPRRRVIWKHGFRNALFSTGDNVGFCLPVYVGRVSCY